VLEEQSRRRSFADLPAGIAEKGVKKRGLHRGITAHITVPAVPKLAGRFNAITTAVGLELLNVLIGPVTLAWVLKMMPLARSAVRAALRSRTNAMDALVAADEANAPGGLGGGQKSKSGEHTNSKSEIRNPKVNVGRMWFE
jgi:hypothetical protein